jgi:putative AlgH/UPF0301 family transcriptional regulator
MSRRKLAFFTTLAMIYLFGARSVFQAKQPGSLRPHSWPDVSKIDSAELFVFPGQPANGSVPPWIRDARHDNRRATFLAVQSKNPDQLALGKLLVASRDLGDPNFAKSVVLLVQYDSQGVVGLMINRRTNVPLSRVFQQLKAAKDLSDPVYAGGPVDIPTAFALLRSQSKVEGAQVLGGVYLISAKPQFEEILSKHPDPAGFHVYLGYAGWTRDQLRMEVKLGAWFIFQGNTQTVFSANPDSLWPEMIRQTELNVTQRLLPDPERAGLKPATFF